MFAFPWLEVDKFFKLGYRDDPSFIAAQGGPKPDTEPVKKRKKGGDGDTAKTKAAAVKALSKKKVTSPKAVPTPKTKAAVKGKKTK